LSWNIKCTNITLKIRFGPIYPKNWGYTLGFLVGKGIFQFFISTTPLQPKTLKYNLNVKMNAILTVQMNVQMVRKIFVPRRYKYLAKLRLTYREEFCALGSQYFLSNTLRFVSLVASFKPGFLHNQGISEFALRSFQVTFEALSVDTKFDVF
jgi:hypothetical protein